MKGSRIPALSLSLSLFCWFSLSLSASLSLSINVLERLSNCSLVTGNLGVMRGLGVGGKCLGLGIW